MGKSWVRNFLRSPPPQVRVKQICAPLLKSGNFLHPPPPSIMVKTSRSCVKTTPKLVVPSHSAWLKLPPPPPPFRRGKTSHAPPPSLFVAPLPVISDQSLTDKMFYFRNPHYFIPEQPLICFAKSEGFQTLLSPINLSASICVIFQMIIVPYMYGSIIVMCV